MLQFPHSKYPKILENESTVGTGGPYQQKSREIYIGTHVLTVPT